MIKAYFKIKYRIIFIFKFRTLKPIKVIDNNSICVTSSKGNFMIDRRCPHQGSFLETGYLKDNILTCRWHGCPVFIDIKGQKV